MEEIAKDINGGHEGGKISQDAVHSQTGPLGGCAGVVRGLCGGRADIDLIDILFHTV